MCSAGTRMDVGTGGGGGDRSPQYILQSHNVNGFGNKVKGIRLNEFWGSRWMDHAPPPTSK